METTKRICEQLIHFELVLVVEAGRVARVPHYEAGAIVVHPALAAAHEEVSRVPHRARAVQERRADGRRPVSWGSPQRVLVAVAAHATEKTI